MKSALLAATMAATIYSGSPYVSYKLNQANPIHVPRYHTKQTYMSQRRAAIKRRKSKSHK
jgi:hypothetical protein